MFILLRSVTAENLVSSKILLFLLQEFITRNKNAWATDEEIPDILIQQPMSFPFNIK
jgi:hypothetical protein